MEALFTGNKPKYMSERAAGADLAAQWGCEVEVGQTVTIDTGTAVTLPHGFVGLLVPRSSLCNKDGLTLVNSVGVLDSDYTGNIKCVYKNNGKKTVKIKTKERIGQLVITPVLRATFQGVAKLDGTVRGCGGFGSTGLV